MSDPVGQFQNEINELDQLSPARYENIFRLYIKDEKFIYNILKRVDIDLSTADPATITTTTLRSEAPWTNISYQLYGTTDLWWLIYLCNKEMFKNPLNLVPGGTKLTVIRTDKIAMVMNEIEQDLKPKV